MNDDHPLDDGPHAAALAQARSLLGRGEYDAARSLLKGIVRADPGCAEAVRLLLEADEDEHRRKMAADEDDSGDSLLVTGRISRQSASDMKSLVFGAAFLVWGLWYLFQFARVGINGERPVTLRSGRVVMESGKETLLRGLGFGGLGGWAFVYGLGRLRLK